MTGASISVIVCEYYCMNMSLHRIHSEVSLFSCKAKKRSERKRGQGGKKNPLYFENWDHFSALAMPEIPPSELW